MSIKCRYRSATSVVKTNGESGIQLCLLKLSYLKRNDIWVIYDQEGRNKAGPYKGI